MIGGEKELKKKKKDRCLYLDDNLILRFSIINMNSQTSMCAWKKIKQLLLPVDVFKNRCVLAF